MSSLLGGLTSSEGLTTCTLDLGKVVRVIDSNSY